MWLASYVVPLPPTRLELPKNISVLTSCASKDQSSAIISVKAKQFLNIPDISVTLSVVNFDKLIDVVLVHPRNILDMLTTSVESDCDKSRDRALQPSNIPDILVTCSMLKEDIFSVFKLVH